MEPIVGTLNESSLHRELKELYAEPGDRLEYPIGQFVADIARNVDSDDPELIEIQTGSFGAMGTKLDHLLPDYRITIVHPIAIRTRLERDDKKPRLSPKRGSAHSLFDELVSIPTLLDHPNLELEVVLVEVIKTQTRDPKARRGLGGYRTLDRRIERLDSTLLLGSMDEVVAHFIPTDLPTTFTTADLATALNVDRSVAQKMTYCFRLSGHILEVDRSRDGRRFTLAYGS
ncbi:MAG: hypothetical protein ACN4GZ_01365 [Acidimicrobiales bacterium]